MSLVDKAKERCRVYANVYDGELDDLINAAFIDLGITDINADKLTEDCDALVLQAVMTYVKMNFGDVETELYERLKRSYDEQKAQLAMASNYTTWSVTP